MEFVPIQALVLPAQAGVVPEMGCHLILIESAPRSGGGGPHLWGR